MTPWGRALAPAPYHLSPSAAAAAAALYGVVTARQAWTHAHNAVHNPEGAAGARWYAPLMAIDFALLVRVNSELSERAGREARVCWAGRA